ncbi:uncharacterized protein LOC111271595 isoform X2 [Varroa jacobsoni]|uniref:cyclic pyranopterin monophosphate synthase n=1 Tax=Varroa destructor TaxID=109461 RepID=A0A7M7KIL3_VARDE|nr:uncharacterized protein LOC111252579 isoform X3 [Varroa destructor]XP_022708229.1 uncharacterized protein LOC111271595 isoform X2 [Varroa jacobsoni]
MWHIILKNKMYCVKARTAALLFVAGLKRRFLSSSSALSHVDLAGKVVQVDVSTKVRRAEAACRVDLPRDVFDLLKRNKLKKGDVLSTARVAGIQASKQTALLIPLCHAINLEHSQLFQQVTLSLDDQLSCVNITSAVTCTGKTGVEMEALTACSVAALCIYDMCKAISQDIRVQNLRLLVKTGGQTDFRRVEADETITPQGDLI